MHQHIIDLQINIFNNIPSILHLVPIFKINLALPSFSLIASFGFWLIWPIGSWQMSSILLALSLMSSAYSIPDHMVVASDVTCYTCMHIHSPYMHQIL